MAVITLGGVDYPAPATHVQMDPEATEFEPNKVPTGATIDSVLNSNFVKKEWTFIKEQATLTDVTVNISAYSEIMLVMLDSTGACLVSETYPVSLATSSSMLNVYFNYNGLQWGRLINGTVLRIGSTSFPVKLYAR